jgi:hypothetical protein
MKKLAGIVAIVTGITVAEILVCFWWPLPAGLSRPALEWLSVGLVYCVLVGDGLLVSIALHGRQQLRRRIVTAYVAPLLVAAPFVGYYWLFGVVDRSVRFAPNTAADLIEGLLLLILLIAISTSVLRRLWRHTRERTVELDAAEWLRQRSRPENARATSASRRVLAVSLIIPTITVLPTFLFMHELLAIRSHVVDPGATSMGEYRITVPLTWMVLWHDSENVYGNVLRGTVRAGKSLYPGGAIYLFGRSSGAEWYVRNEKRSPTPWYQQRDRSFFEYNDLVDTREVPFLGSMIHCSRYVPKRQWAYGADATSIDCLGPQGVSARFGGDARDREAFYRMLSDVKLAQ